MPIWQGQDTEQRNKELLAWANDLDVTERPASGEFDVSEAIRNIVSENECLRMNLRHSNAGEVS